MQYRLLHRLGTIEATKLNKEFGTSLPLSPSEALATGAIIELNDKAAEWLIKKHSSLVEPVSVKAVAKKSEIQGQ
jgi:hypothetical protein